MYVRIGAFGSFWLFLKCEMVVHNLFGWGSWFEILGAARLEYAFWVLTNHSQAATRCSAPCGRRIRTVADVPCAFCLIMCLDCALQGNIVLADILRHVAQLGHHLGCPAHGGRTVVASLDCEVTELR